MRTRAVDGLGRADGGRPAVRHQAGRHARARRRAHRGRAAADRGGLLQQPEGDDRVADVLAVRDGAGPPGAASTRAVSSASARCARSSAAARRGRSSASRSTGTRSRQLYDAVGLRAGGRRDRVARRRAGLPQRPPGRQGDVDDVVAGAEADDRAGDGRSRRTTPRAPTLQIEMTVEAVRHRVARDGREDAVLQPAAKDGHVPPRSAGDLRPRSLAPSIP